MSRILKAPYVTVDNNNCFSVDNTFNITQNSIKNQDSNIEEIKVETDLESSFDQSYRAEVEISQDDKKILQNMKDEILDTTRKQADEIIQNAKNQAKDIIEQANIEAKSQIEQIYQENKENGYKDGFEQGKANAQILKDEAEAILLEANKQKELIQKNIEPDLIELVIGISQNILTNSFKINPELVSVLIQKGLKNAKELNNLKITVSENQYHFVLNNKEDILGFNTQKYNVEIMQDSSLEDEDCIIETEFGTIKCGVNDQFGGIKQALYQLF